MRVQSFALHPSVQIQHRMNKNGFSNGPGDVKSPRVAAELPVQQVSRVMVISSVSDLVSLSKVDPSFASLPFDLAAGYLLLSVVSANSCQHDAIRKGSGEHYLASRGSSDDDQLPNLRLHHVHRPGDGTSGSKGGAPLSDSSSSVIEAYTRCLEGHGSVRCVGRAERSYPRSRGSGFAPWAQRG